MTDVHDPAVRSYNMSKIRSKDTKPEMIVRKFLFAHGFRYRLHQENLPGKPDITLKKYNAVIFVNGCFWHGHENCSYFKLPATRTKWWKSKIMANRERDAKNITKLIKAGYRTITLWECDLKGSNLDKTLNMLLKKILE
ncbi:MAG: DNA mismatch endonuclease Vsr [Bacteroidales bacterium]|nr:DNA mismatch endonuclease Vsr [Bacteroidales bacterium]